MQTNSLCAVCQSRRRRSPHQNMGPADPYRSHCWVSHSSYAQVQSTDPDSLSSLLQLTMAVLSEIGHLTPNLSAVTSKVCTVISAAAYQLSVINGVTKQSQKGKYTTRVVLLSQGVTSQGIDNSLNNHSTQQQICGSHDISNSSSCITTLTKSQNINMQLWLWIIWAAVSTIIVNYRNYIGIVVSISHHSYRKMIA